MSKTLFTERKLCCVTRCRRCRSYWSGTGSFEAVTRYDEATKKHGCRIAAWRK